MQVWLRIRPGWPSGLAATQPHSPLSATRGSSWGTRLRWTLRLTGTSSGRESRNCFAYCVVPLLAWGWLVRFLATRESWWASHHCCGSNHSAETPIGVQLSARTHQAVFDTCLPDQSEKSLAFGLACKASKTTATGLEQSLHRSSLNEPLLDKMLSFLSPVHVILTRLSLLSNYLDKLVFKVVFCPACFLHVISSCYLWAESLPKHLLRHTDCLRLGILSRFHDNLASQCQVQCHSARPCRYSASAVSQTSVSLCSDCLPVVMACRSYLLENW